MALNKLGNAVQIIRGGPESVKSTEFFQNLGFRLLREGDTPFGTKFALLTDGVVNLLLSDEHMDEVLPTLQKRGVELHAFSGGDISSGNALVIAPNGQTVLLVKGKV